MIPLSTTLLLSLLGMLRLMIHTLVARLKRSYKLNFLFASIGLVRKHYTQEARGKKRLIRLAISSSQPYLVFRSKVEPVGQADWIFKEPKFCLYQKTPLSNSMTVSIIMYANGVSRILATNVCEKNRDILQARTFHQRRFCPWSPI